MENMNFYRIKYALKMNKLLHRKALPEKETYCAFRDVAKNLHCRRLSIQLHEQDKKEEVLRILPLLLENGIELELIEFDRIFANEDIRKLKQMNPEIVMDFRYMLETDYWGKNVESIYDVGCYCNILDKIEYLAETAKTNFPSVEEQVVFIACQLADYISFYDTYKELSEEQFKQKSSLKGAFLEKETVCIGYSMAFERCMSALGVESKIIQGDGNFSGKRNAISPWEGNHAWNAVNMKGKWYNLDVTWLSGYRRLALENAETNKKQEHDAVEKYVLSDDTNFENHYKLEDNGIRCEEPLKNRLAIYERVKQYKNVLDAYDKGKRNYMLQVELENNTKTYKEKTEECIKNKTAEHEDLEETSMEL